MKVPPGLRISVISANFWAWTSGRYSKRPCATMMSNSCRRTGSGSNDVGLDQVRGRLLDGHVDAVVVNGRREQVHQRGRTAANVQQVALAAPGHIVDDPQRSFPSGKCGWLNFRFSLLQKSRW